jgi:hypothetical protein
MPNSAQLKQSRKDIVRPAWRYAEQSRNDFASV